MLITILTIAILIFSIIIHEYGHAWMANRLGDSTAKDLGRLTLNPIPHIDLFGSIVLPLFFVLSGSGFILAWAKPVPYNPGRVRDKKYGDLKIALSGPLANLILALVFGLLARFMPLSGALKSNLLNYFLLNDTASLLTAISGQLMIIIWLMAVIFCFLNLLLAFFNLLPIPPLDGSKIILNFLPLRFRLKFFSWERWGMLVVLALLLLGWFKYLMYPILSVFFFLIGF